VKSIANFVNLKIKERIRESKRLTRFLIITIIFILIICFWKIIISSILGGFITFFAFILYYLLSFNIFLSLIVISVIIYLIYITKTANKRSKFRGSKLVFLFFILVIPILIIPSYSRTIKTRYVEDWNPSMITGLNRSIDLFDIFNATVGFKQRQDIYLNNSKLSNGLDAQSVRVYLGLPVNEETIENSLDVIINFKDGMDFRLNSLLRLIYLDLNASVLSSTIKNKVIDAFGNAKYWHTEPNEDDAIFWTENHQILFHTAELLAGQLFPNDSFINSGMTGKEHVVHATPLINRWFDWRAKFGFTEWHSNTYFALDIAALVNLVDFANNTEIVYKAAMMLDIIAFDFANNYYKGKYATTHGRAYDRTKVGESETNTASEDGTSESAWLMLDLGLHDPGDDSDRAAVALATSNHYAPPPILEDIANNATNYNEHRERNSIYLTEGPKYNVSYTEDDLMYWWSMSAPLASQIIDVSYAQVEKYDLKTDLIYGPQILSDFLKISSILHGLTLNEYSEALKLITEGVCLQASNTYTYRTPYYQLSGAQDHQKGTDGMQEHIWQATLDENAFVYTSSPGGLTKDFNQEFVGGWKPRATLYKNVGIVQYDRETMPLEAEILIYLLNLLSGSKFYTHAYFPRWAFDEVQYHDNWIFGAEDDGYIALYSYMPTQWVSNYELRVNGFKNLWIVEMGSVDEYASFNQFVSTIRQSNIEVTPQALGYNVHYTSPSLGVVSVAWDGIMQVDGNNIDLGPYPRFDNDYCYQDFGTKITLIEFGNQSLELNFNNYSRVYQNLN